MASELEAAAAEVDRTFGPSYARKNPRLVAAVLLQRATLDLANAINTLAVNLGSR
jgi:hypothetical protein